MKFYLGTHHPHWLRDARFIDVPLFVSRRTLAKYKKLPRAVGRWALDSGGFTELNLHGKWTITPVEYAREVKRFRDEIGGMDFAAPQDWMCEEKVLKKTGLTVAEHQRRTIANFLDLRALDCDVIPVIQGWTMGDYLRCVEDYFKAGVDLRTYPTVGVGSVCRRDAEYQIEEIIHTLAFLGIKCHAFGVKGSALPLIREEAVSGDSLAWSKRASHAPPLPECAKEGKHKNCANCPRFALQWREKQLKTMRQMRQLKVIPYRAELACFSHVSEVA